MLKLAALKSTDDAPPPANSTPAYAILQAAGATAFKVSSERKNFLSASAHQSQFSPAKHLQCRDPRPQCIPAMHVLLIRHAESVDNVASLFGGSRDAVLTAHGVLQAQRLASSLVAIKLEIKHVLASNLQRAVKTARAICDAYNESVPSAAPVSVVQCPELREKHFGNWEGIKYGAGTASKRPPQVGAETSQSLQERANAFLDDCLYPVLEDNMDRANGQSCIAVVSHGIMLNALFRALMEKANSPSYPGCNGALPLKPSWSNTGYLDFVLTRTPELAPSQDSSWAHLRMEVMLTNCTTHLKGLRKTRGGIGSSAFDKNQISLDTFFNCSRKRKADDESTK